MTCQSPIKSCVRWHRRAPDCVGQQARGDRVASGATASQSAKHRGGLRSDGCMAACRRFGCGFLKPTCPICACIAPLAKPMEIEQPEGRTDNRGRFVLPVNTPEQNAGRSI
jgi:hypothetical protein